MLTVFVQYTVLSCSKSSKAPSNSIMLIGLLSPSGGISTFATLVAVRLFWVIYSPSWSRYVSSQILVHMCIQISRHLTASVVTQAFFVWKIWVCLHTMGGQRRKLVAKFVCGFVFIVGLQSSSDSGISGLNMENKMGFASFGFALLLVVQVQCTPSRATVLC
jgi:hypothetical protein